MTLVDRMVRFLLPKEIHFFEMLERSAQLAVEATTLLEEIVTAPPDGRSAVMQRIRDVEHASDANVHAVYDALNRTFVTPIDRSDIYALASKLEDVVDRVHATALQLSVHAMTDTPAGSIELATLSKQAATEAHTAVSLLRNASKLEGIRGHCQQMSKLEHDGDEVFRKQVGLLFANESNAVRLIQHKEFLEGLERTLDACDHTGGTLTAIVIKHA
jgi:uncharacterized protein